MAATHEDQLRVARENLEQAREGFDRAVTRAHAAGMSLRQIAEHAGVSHETVRRMVGD